MSRKSIKNPIIPGNFPDPSICRVKEDFYMVCSSFELCPGLPVFHSKDLANWEMIGNAMTIENGLHVEYNSMFGGLMAPTIRYWDGTFYIINANFCDRGNYIITAVNPQGPWSEPVWLSDVPGIDASLFIDDDGVAYIIGTGMVWEDAGGKKDRGVWMAPYDLKEFKLLGEPVTIFNSGMRIAVSPEAPHIYHVGDYYYMLIAEGGTEHYHSVMVARSKEVLGWYESCPANPVMTHRHMGFGCPITNVGHADLVELPDGSWYAVMLGSRPFEGKYKSLGRETFICPVQWEREWPLFSPETGKIEFEYPESVLHWSPFEKKLGKTEFTKTDKIPLDFSFLGTPYDEFYKIDSQGLHIRCIPSEMAPEIQQVSFNKNTNKDRTIPFIGKRQQFFNSTAECLMHFTPEKLESAGLIIAQAMNHQIRFEMCKGKVGTVLRVVLVTTEFKAPPYMPGFNYTQEEKELVRIPYGKEKIYLKIVANEDYSLFYGENYDNMSLLTKVNLSLINPESISSLSGTMIGMFASGNKEESDGEAIFEWFSLEGKND